MLHDFLHDGRVTSKELHLFLEPDNIFLECTNVTASLIVRRHLITVQSEEKSISARVIKYEKKNKNKRGIRRRGREYNRRESERKATYGSVALKGRIAAISSNLDLRLSARRRRKSVCFDSDGELR